MEREYFPSPTFNLLTQYDQHRVMNDGYLSVHNTINDPRDGVPRYVQPDMRHANWLEQHDGQEQPKKARKARGWGEMIESNYIERKRRQRLAACINTKR